MIPISPADIFKEAVVAYLRIRSKIFHGTSKETTMSIRISGYETEIKAEDVKIGHQANLKSLPASGWKNR
jgi:LEA14-like dessication related protein